MIKSALYVTFTMMLMGFSTAQAETFTYMSKTDNTTIVGGVGPDGGDYVGTYSTGSGTSTSSDGKVAKSTSTCVSMKQPANSNIFASHVACDVTSADFTFSVVYGCNPLNKEATEMSCVGGLTGKSGKYEGKYGSITFHGKGGVGSGTGQWY